MPPELFDAVLEGCLTLLAAHILSPEPEGGWDAVSAFSTDWSLELGGRAGWAMLARCPERWPQLTAHPRFGAAVQHLLHGQAETQAPEDASLRAAGPTARTDSYRLTTTHARAEQRLATN